MTVTGGKSRWTAFRETDALVFELILIVVTTIASGQLFLWHHPQRQSGFGSSICVRPALDTALGAVAVVVFAGCVIPVRDASRRCAPP